VSVAKRATNPLFALILALILESVSERLRISYGAVERTRSGIHRSPH
jgi:hypothetical protein